MSLFGRVDLRAAGTVAIVAGGRSLIGLDFDRLRGLCPVIAVKGSMFDIPFAACGVGVDRQRLGEWAPRFGALPFPVYWATTEAIWAANRCDLPANVVLVNSLASYEVSSDPALIHCGGTSGFTALNVAILAGATNIVLLGYDYRPDERAMRHNDRHYSPRAQRSEYWAGWARSYSCVAAPLAARGITVLNASPQSAIEAFPKVTIDQAMDHLHRVRSA